MPALTRTVSPRSPPNPRRRSPNSLPVVRPSPPSTSAVTDHLVSRTPASRTYAPPNVPSSTGGLGGKSPDPPRKSFTADVASRAGARLPLHPAAHAQVEPCRQRRLVAERCPLRQRVVRVVVGHEQRVQRVADSVAGRERIHAGHVPIPAQRQPPPGRVAQHGEPAGDPLVAEPVPHGAVEVGEPDARQRAPGTRDRTKVPGPDRSGTRRSAARRRTRAPLSGHRVGQPLGQAGQSRPRSRESAAPRQDRPRARASPASHRSGPVNRWTGGAARSGHPASGRPRSQDAGVRLRPSRVPAPAARPGASRGGPFASSAVLGRVGQRDVECDRPAGVDREVVEGGRRLERDHEVAHHRQPHPPRDDLAVGHPVAAVLEAVLQVGVDAHDLVGEGVEPPCRGRVRTAWASPA